MINGYVYVYYDGVEQPALRETRSLYSSGKYTPSAHLPSHDPEYDLYSIWMYDLVAGTSQLVTNATIDTPTNDIYFDYYFTSPPPPPPITGTQAWIYSDGWKQATPYIFHNGWKEATPNIYSGGWE